MEDFKEIDLSHLTEQQVVRYGQKQLSVADLLVVDEHLSACVACRKQIVAFIQSSLCSPENNLYRNEVNSHLVYEDQVKYFSGQLTEERLEYCLNHIIWCEPCRMELLDFSLFYSHLNPVGDELTVKSEHLREGSTPAPKSSADFTSQLSEQFFKSLND